MTLQLDETEATVQRLARERHRTGVFLIILAMLMAAMVVALFFLFSDLQKTESLSSSRDERITKLETALDLQRQQFEVCKNKKPNAPGCTAAVAPSSGEINGPKGEQGLQGIQGIQGPPGPQGPRGLRGLTGLPGEDGSDGLPGQAGQSGTDGADGEQGAPGPQGATGPQGPTGVPGPKGDPGPAGPAGSDGADAPRITDVSVRGTPAECVLVVTLSDDTSYSTGVPGQFCAGPNE